MERNNKQTLPHHTWPQKLLFSEHFLQFIEPIPEAVVISNANGNIVQINEEACRLFGYTRDELLQLTIEDLVPESIRDKHVSFRQAFFKHPRPRYLNSRNLHLTFRHKSGKETPMEAALFSIMSDDGPLAVNFMRDTTVLQELTDTLTQRALYDELTNLPNRRFFNEQLALTLKRAKREKKPLGLLYINLDQFKPINDEHGHKIGDAVLAKTGKRCKSVLRESDFFARLGGDEFCLLLYPIESADDCEVVAKKLSSVIQQTIKTNNLRLKVESSIGIADTKTPPTYSAKELLQRGDKAMYHAKQLGNDYCKYSDLI